MILLVSCNRGYRIATDMAIYPNNQLYYVVDTIQIKNPVIVQKKRTCDMAPDIFAYVFDIDSTQTPYESITSELINRYLADSIFYYSGYEFMPQQYYFAKNRLSTSLRNEFAYYFEYGLEGFKIKDIELYGSTYEIYKPKKKYDGFLLCLCNITLFYGAGIENKSRNFIPVRLTYMPIVYPYTKYELSTKDKEEIRKANERTNKKP